MPVDPARWLYSITKREYVHNDFLIDPPSRNVRMSTESGPQPGSKTQREWSSDQQQVTSLPRRAIRRLACAHEMVSTCPETISVGQVCDRGNIFTFRTSGTILNEFRQSN